MDAEELVVVNGGVIMQSNNQQEDERSKKKMKKEHKGKTEDIVNIDKYIVEDIVNQILVKIPAESLFNTFMYVCKLWFNIISTYPSINLYRLVRSKHPFLILQSVDNTSEDYTTDYTTSFIKMGKQGIEEEFDLTPVFKKLRIRACCNGLILATLSGLKNMKTLYVVNPLTNHQVKLPTRPLDSDFRFTRDSYSETIKFIFKPSTKEYQVIVGGFIPGTGGFMQYMQSKSYIQILTLSADDCSASSNDDGHLIPHREWRIIEVPEGQSMRQANTRGFFIWTWGWDKRITFDVNTEKFHEISHPIGSIYLRITSFMEMNGFLFSWSLGLVNEHDDFWTLRTNILKDFDTGEWIHQYSVKIDPSFFKPPETQLPVLSFGNGEVLIFQDNSDKTLRAYNVKLNRWWKVGNKLEEWDEWSFIDFHVSNKYVPIESLYTNYT